MEPQLLIERTDTKKIKMMLRILCLIFVLGTLCLQAFNLVFQNIGNDLGMPQYASLITSIPGIVLGIVCFIYGSLGDFISLRKMMIAGISVLVLSSIIGFFFSFNIWIVILCRCFQTAGAQASGSVFLVMTSRYLDDSEKPAFFGLFNASYQASVLIGIVAGGILTTINWTYLFLIPVISVFFIPYLLKNIPDDVPSGNVHIDIPGFVIIGLAVSFLTLYFTLKSLPMLGIAIALFLIFAVYINKASDPFITPEFFTNKKWLIATLLIFILYFVNYSLTPTFNAAGKAIYGFTPAQVSFMLIPTFVMAMTVSLNSGKIISKLGKPKVLLIAISLITTGRLAEAYFIDQGPLFVIMCAAMFYCGAGLLYAPLYDIITGTVSKNETGRVLGLNDLVLNTTASIGVSIFAPMMIPDLYMATNLLGKSGVVATYSNLFLIYGGVSFAGLIVYFIARKIITSK